jgi:hypothetical protein
MTLSLVCRPAATTLAFCAGRVWANRCVLTDLGPAEGADAVNASVSVLESLQGFQHRPVILALRQQTIEISANAEPRLQRVCRTTELHRR